MGRTEEMAEKKMTQTTVLKMIKNKRITASKGAELLKMPLQDFLELMSQHHIPVLGCESGEIRQDLKSLKEAFAKAKVPK